MFLRAHALRLAPFVFGAVLVLTACSGGADNGQVPQSDNLTIPAAGGTLTIPSAGGYSGTITFPPATGGGGARAALQGDSSQPGGTPALGATGMYYFGLYVAATVSWATSPSFTIQLPQSAGAGPYYLAVYDTQNNAAGWTLNSIGPGVVNGSTITFPSVNAQTSIGSGDIRWFALHT